MGRRIVNASIHLKSFERVDFSSELTEATRGPRLFNQQNPFCVFPVRNNREPKFSSLYTQPVLIGSQLRRDEFLVTVHGERYDLLSPRGYNDISDSVELSFFSFFLKKEEKNKNHIDVPSYRSLHSSDGIPATNQAKGRSAKSAIPVVDSAVECSRKIKEILRIKRCAGSSGNILVPSTLIGVAR